MSDRRAGRPKTVQHIKRRTVSQSLTDTCSETADGRMMLQPGRHGSGVSVMRRTLRRLFPPPSCVSAPSGAFSVAPAPRRASSELSHGAGRAARATGFEIFAW